MDSTQNYFLQCSLLKSIISGPQKIAVRVNTYLLVPELKAAQPSSGSLLSLSSASKTVCTQRQICLHLIKCCD